MRRGAEFRRPPTLLAAGVLLCASTLGSASPSAVPSWMTPGTRLGYSWWPPYVNLSREGETCSVSSRDAVFSWSVLKISGNLASIELELDLIPPLHLSGDCGWLDPQDDSPLILKGEVEVDLTNRRASSGGVDLGPVPLWIEGLVPGAEVDLSGSSGGTLVGVVGRHRFAGEYAGRMVEAISVTARGIGGLEVECDYDAATGVLLGASSDRGEIDSDVWSALRVLHFEGADRVEAGALDLAIINSSVRLTEARGVLALLHGMGWWFVLLPEAALAASAVGLILLSLRVGGFEEARRTPLGRILFAIFLASFAVLVLLVIPAATA